MTQRATARRARLVCSNSGVPTSSVQRSIVCTAAPGLQRCRSSSYGSTRERCNLNRRRGLVLGNNSLQPCIILKQALAGEDEEVITEFRTLEVDLKQLIVLDC